MFAFQYQHLDRQGELRHDGGTLKSILDNKQTLFLPIYKQYVASESNHLLWLNQTDLINSVGTLSDIHLIYLGKAESSYYFAYRLASAEQLKTIAPESDNLRNLLPYLSEKDAYLANVATALNQWHASHQHCGFCGAETYAKDSGFVRLCSNPDCAKEHFPRTDPAIIVAITHTDKSGAEKILLGRQAQWPEKRYSVIAGFVEPGESLEQAVKREALEEVGLEVKQVTYQASQPWPFPQSVMLGFNAQATSSEIHLKDQELETADWFERETLLELVKNEQLILPFKYSISRSLIENWLYKSMN